jgi:NADH:ubiquinone oxidoreductase subunit 2 (subunit N)
VVISIYYYFGVIRAIYWSKEAPDLSPIPISPAVRIALYGCGAGMLYLGLFPNTLVEVTTQAVAVLGR